MFELDYFLCNISKFNVVLVFRARTSFSTLEEDLNRMYCLCFGTLKQ
jgi:hypothetical protein